MQPYNADVSPGSWYMPNKLEFQNWVSTVFRYTKPAYNDSLYGYQRFVKDFMQYDSPYRGVLLYHGLGVGKTRTSIATAELLSDNLDIVVMLPASLKNNFIREIQKSGHAMIRTDQHWQFVLPASPKYVSQIDLFTEFGISAAYAKKKKGVWIPIKGKPSNFDKLDESSKASLLAQLNDMINARYQFIHYNGLQLKGVNEMVKNSETGNPFDNKVVIIDEAHNFVSRVMTPDGKIGKKLYQLLMEATNLKLMLLTGTPIINSPLEIAYMFNLVHGYILVHQLHYTNTKPFDQDKVIEYLKAHPNINHFSVKHDIREVHVGLLPQGFEKASDPNMVARSGMDEGTTEDILEDIRVGLYNLGVGKKNSAFKHKKHYLLPTDADVFEKYFVDYDSQTNHIKNPILLSRRLQGLLSYYEAYDPKDFPRAVPLQHIHVKMTTQQFSRYVSARQKEIDKERRALKMSKVKQNNNDVKKGANVYRLFTRALCNWAFPEGIERPWPDSLRQMKEELDIGEEEDADFEKAEEDDKQEGGAMNPIMKRAYHSQIASALKALANNDKYLVGEGLKKQGPKIYEIITRLQGCPGTALVYSVFRNVEGLKILSLALDANGYAELKVKKNARHEWELDVDEEDYAKPKYIQFTSGNGEGTKILLDLFNSDFDQLPPNIVADLKAMHPERDIFQDKNHHGKIAQTLMITQSGSEGISLKNVRQVHMLEPYWNDIRIRQVIGRAIRAKSHLSLPENERVVETFMYILKLTGKQKQDTLLSTNDKGLTSDEHVFNIAQKKAAINDGLMEIVQAASIDCFINKPVNKKISECFVPPHPKNKTNNDVYPLDNIDNDITDAHMKQITKQITTKRIFKKFKVKGIDHVFDTETLEYYLADNTTNAVGKVLELNEKGHPKRIEKYEGKQLKHFKVKGVEYAYNIATMEYFAANDPEIILGVVVELNEKGLPKKLQKIAERTNGMISFTLKGTHYVFDSNTMLYYDAQDTSVPIGKVLELNAKGMPKKVYKTPTI